MKNAEVRTGMRWDWRQRLLSRGTDPDPRFTLANERTFLAGIRTSLALTAGGIGLEAFAGDVFPPRHRLLLSVLLLGFGALLAVLVFLRWYASERAMRMGRQLPLPVTGPFLSFGIAATGLILILLLVLP